MTSRSDMDAGRAATNLGASAHTGCVREASRKGGVWPAAREKHEPSTRAQDILVIHCLTEKFVGHNGQSHLPGYPQESGKWRPQTLRGCQCAAVN